MNSLLERLKAQGEVQVADCEKIIFHHEAGNIVYIDSQARPHCAIPFMTIVRAIWLVRRNPNMYTNAPLVSHTTGAGHISDAVWSILHLMTLEQLLA